MFDPPETSRRDGAFLRVGGDFNRSGGGAVGGVEGDAGGGGEVAEEAGEEVGHRGGHDEGGGDEKEGGWGLQVE